MSRHLAHVQNYVTCITRPRAFKEFIGFCGDTNGSFFKGGNIYGIQPIFICQAKDYRLWSFINAMIQLGKYVQTTNVDLIAVVGLTYNVHRDTAVSD